MSDDMSAVLGATTTMKTLADGTFRISVDVEPRFAQQAFALFGAPGTPIALARITNEAAVEQDRANTATVANTAKGGDYGQQYAALYKSGWFHNPRVIQAFSVDKSWAPEDRIEAIKEYIYDDFEVGTLTAIDPARFIEYCDGLGLRATLPAAFGGAT